MSLFDALQNGASVFICKKESLQLAPPPPNANFQNGIVTLSVTETLCGPSFQKISLAYCYIYSPRRPNIWPDVTGSKVGPLLCVTVPDDVNPMARRSPSIPSVALLVFDITADKTNIVDAFRLISKMQQETDQEVLKTLLVQALESPNKWLNSYAIQFIICNYAGKYPAMASALVHRLVDDYNKDGNKRTLDELEGIVGFSLIIAIGEKYQEKSDRRLVTHNIIFVLSARSLMVQRAVLETLGFCLRPGELKGYLTADDSDALKNALSVIQDLAPDRRANLQSQL